MNFDTIINEYARSHGIAPLAFDEQGILHFLINDTIAVSIEKTLDNQGFFIYTVLGKIPAGRELTFTLATLEGNLFGKETGRASIGYDPLTHSLVLFRYFDGAYLETNTLANGFDDFLQIYAYWMGKLNKLP